MSTTSQISALATAIGAKIKIAIPPLVMRAEAFGAAPTASSASITATSSTLPFGVNSFVSDGGTLAPSWVIWPLPGNWKGTHQLAICLIGSNVTAIIKIEWSKDGGVTWATLNAGYDTYLAAANFFLAKFTGLVIPEGSEVLLKFTAVGKNASAAGYYVALAGWTMQRTGP